MTTQRHEPSSDSTGAGAPTIANEAAPPALLSASRVPQLDGIRGVAILLVLWAHFSNFKAADRTALIDRLYYFFSDSGAYGVDLFFVLSGFLITGILLDSKGRSKHYFRNFYVRRVLRIFPLYYGFLAFMVFGLPVIAKAIHHPDAAMTDNLKHIQWMFWLYVSNFGEVMGIDVNGTAVGVFWSLAVEEQFYLVWPLVVFVSSSRWLRRICIMIVVVALLVRIGFTIAGHSWWMFTFARMDSLAIGALCALAVRQPDLRIAGPRALWTASGILAVLAYVVCPALPESPATPYIDACRVLLFAALFGILILIAVQVQARGRLAQVLSNRVLVFFGTYSYGLYVIHSLVRAAMIRAWPPLRWHGTYLPWQAVFGLIGLGGCVVLALLSYHLYEKWFLNLKRWFAN